MSNNLITGASIMTTERKNTITAAEWHKVAADVAAGRCEVWDNSMPEPAKIDDVITTYHGIDDYRYGVHYSDVTDPNDLVQFDGGEIFTVRWLDTPAPETSEQGNDLEAMYANYLNIAKSHGVDNPFSYTQSLQAYKLAADSLTESHQRLQAERDDLRQQLADTRAAGQTSQNLWLDEKERYNSLYNNYILQQQLVEELEDKLAAPQPSPAPTSELVEALKTVYEAVIQCDLQSDMLEAYKAPYDDTVHTDHPNFAALNDWAYLSNAFDLLWEHRKAAEALKAVNSDNS